METGWTTPIAPASETAATSSGLVHGYMAPQISGTSMPTWRVNTVSDRLIVARWGRSLAQNSNRAHVDKNVLINMILQITNLKKSNNYAHITFRTLTCSR